MATSKVVYKGELRTEATHLKSGNTFVTDAPTDNQGRGEAYSPSDLAATSLASCMMTIMGIAAQARNIEIRSLEAEVTKVMKADPRRISEIIIDMTVDAPGISEGHKEVLRQAAENCPVAKSLHPEIEQKLSIRYL